MNFSFGTITSLPSKVSSVVERMFNSRTMPVRPSSSWM